MMVMKSYHGFFVPVGKEGGSMRGEEKQLYKVFRAGGRSFSVYLERDEQTGESYPAYPDFEERPEYTDEGRPFALAAQESCPHAKPNAPGETPSGDCGGCGWFHRDNTPYDPIGVCLCDARRREPESEKEETK